MLASTLTPVEHTELRHCTLHIMRSENAPIINAENFSTWRRLYRVIAVANDILIKEAELSENHPEILTLRSGKRIESDSKLIPLNVYISDENTGKSQKLEFCRFHNFTEKPSNHFSNSSTLSRTKLPQIS
ncbi:uncharacterized protein LOC129249866 [Anastrepha obliqua]|uniref:uncharacterized protein LOC129249866 n=1 Tax=Anastrepha obliqua TaxID=95512 RepID=UPI00240A16E2|nr:uncharacterized protein LOC129249866 [Anastrepha obliqua]